MKRVQSPSDIPSGRHFAVMIYTTDSIYIEGDERSRSHPGHGYPAHYEMVNKFEHYVFQNEAECAEFIGKNLDRKDKMVCFEVNRKLTFQVKTNVSLG